MNYLLAKKEDLEAQGYNYRYSERLPDGRVILPLNALRVLSGFTPEIISGENLKSLIREQKESGLYNPEEGADEGGLLPDSGSGADTPVEDVTGAEELPSVEESEEENVTGEGGEA